MYQGKVFPLLSLFNLLALICVATNCPAIVGNAGGGQLHFLDGSTHQYVCKKTAAKTIIHLKHHMAHHGEYVYVITNDRDMILGYSEDRSVDMSYAPAGTYHVWGVAYSGQPKRPTQVPIQEAIFADGHYSVSDNFLQLVYADIASQTVLADGKDYYPIDEYGQPVVTFKTSSIQSGNFVYVVTNYRKRVIGLTQDQFDFTQFGIGEYEVFGYHYTGDLKIKPGDFMLGDISDGCFEKSLNSVLIDKMVPAGLPIVPETPENPNDTPMMFADADGNSMAYETTEMTVEAAQLFDKEAAMMDDLMIGKLAQSLEPECEAYAGVVLPDQNQVFFNDNTLTISATTVEPSVSGKNGDVQYLLVAQHTGTIEAIASTPNFMISRSGTYHIYPMVANINHPDRQDYFDLMRVDLGHTTLKQLENDLSALCADLTANAATIVVTSAFQTCQADAGTLSADAHLVELKHSTATLSAQQIDTPTIPNGFEPVYLLTKFNQIVSKGSQPRFTVREPGDYSIVALIVPKAGHGYPTLNFHQVKTEAGSSIFQLIEYIDMKKICASVSNWDVTTVVQEGSISFGGVRPTGVLVVSR